MRIWADVYDTSGAQRLAPGPITAIQSASVTRALDGPGSFTLSLAGSDMRTLQYITNKSYLKIYTDNAGSSVSAAFRLLGEGIVEEIRVRESSGGVAFSITGYDPLSLLKQKNTLMNRSYSGQSVSTIASSLAALAGFTASVSGGIPTSIRYDGETVLKAFQMLCESQGLHFRLGSAANTIEVNAMGNISGYRAINARKAEADFYNNDYAYLLDSLDIVTDSKDIANWIVPFGAGEGVAALTLQHSTRTTPYTIQSSAGPDGRTFYYLKDTTSIGLYGQIEKIVTFKDIAPLTNTEADTVAAANALYDAAAAYLARYASKLEIYGMTVRKVWNTIKPGDKIYVRYKGIVTRDGSPFTYRDINQDMWILEATENVSNSGLTVSFKVATIDRYEQNAAQRIIAAQDAIALRNRRPNPVPTVSTFTHLSDISSTFPAIIPVRISDAVISLIRCQVRLKTSSREGSSATPTTISVYVDNVDRTSALGGPWAGGGGATTINLDPALMTGYLVNAAGGLQQEHSIEVDCASSSGRVEALVELTMTTQAVPLI